MTLRAATSLFAAFALSLTLGACDKKGGENSELGKLCVEASDLLAKDAGAADGETFQLMLSNALKACSGGCDDEHTASCGLLKGHLEKICGVSPDMCNSFCETATEGGSLKKTACEVKAAAPKPS